MKGSVAFYRGNYQDAVKYFTKALQGNPNSPGITMNLADTYVELGAIQRAIELYRSIADGKPVWSYSMGRALLYKNEFQEALKYLEGLPTDFKNGAARVIEAAAVAGVARNQAGAEQKAEILERARKNLSVGIAQDPTYWHGILSGRKRDIHEGYTIPIILLEAIYEKEDSK